MNRAEALSFNPYDDDQVAASEDSRQPQPLWSITDGSFDAYHNPPDRGLIKDIFYMYGQMEQPKKRVNTDAELTIYAVKLCQPEIFSEPANREIKRAATDDIREAAAVCQAQDTERLLPHLAQIAAHNNIIGLPPVSAIRSFELDDNVSSRLTAVTYYIALEQAGLKDFLPPAP